MSSPIKFGVVRETAHVCEKLTLVQGQVQVFEREGGGGTASSKGGRFPGGSRDMLPQKCLKISDFQHF